MDSTNSDGAPIWILSAQMDWVRQNLHLVNSVMRSGIWYIDCDPAGSPPAWSTAMSSAGC